MALIELEEVGKSFSTQRGRGLLVGRGGVADWIRGKKSPQFDALNDISFTVERGESVGIIGANGSGKSTLLKILAGVTAPTRGRVTVNGKVASLLELGAGFHPLLTGRENIYLNGRILGMTPADVDRVFDRIVEFSGIEEFIDNPVETYSSGMFVRLGFAVAVHANPDIFLVDEVLSVGDEDFQRKCRERIGQLREEGKTIVFVSHDLSIVNTLCERVILLSGGTMVVRDSAQATIDYYLRLVGRKKGIHRFAQGSVEAILSHGRLSVFHGQREASAPSGFQVHLTSMGEVHSSANADWDVVERSEAGCVARGRMPKLPATQSWCLRIEAGRIRWEVSLEVERPMNLRVADVNLFFPTAYTHWIYGDESGGFPPIPHAQTGFLAMHPANGRVHDVAAYPDAGNPLPALMVHLVGESENRRLQWVNTDYVMGCRALQAEVEFPLEEANLSPGIYPLVSLELDLEATPSMIAEVVDRYRRERTLTSGDLSAQWDSGMVRLSRGGQELTEAVHIYNSLFMNNLWNDSQSMHWEKPVPGEGGMTVHGRSRRFPFSQTWDLRPVEGGFELCFWLETHDLLLVQEYQVSVGLKAAYDRWETALENGLFPVIRETDDDWVHLNREYTPSEWAKALSGTLPSVMLEVSPEAPAFRMTAINTGYRQSARVLQALRTPEAGGIRFDAGRHLLFQGRITVLEA